MYDFFSRVKRAPVTKLMNQAWGRNSFHKKGKGCNVSTVAQLVNSVRNPY